MHFVNKGEEKSFTAHEANYFSCYSVVNLEYFTYFRMYTHLYIHTYIYTHTHNHEQLSHYCSAVFFPRKQ